MSALLSALAVVGSTVGMACAETAPTQNPAAEPASRCRNGAIWYDTDGHVVNAHGGGVLAHGGKYYLYGEHKVYGKFGNRAHVGVHMYSSADLATWKDEGVVLGVENDQASDIADGCVIERPKIVYNAKTGKFVMYFHLERRGRGYSDARVGIAVADGATGPYKFIRSLNPTPGTYPVNAREEDKTPEALERSKREQDSRDMTSSSTTTARPTSSIRARAIRRCTSTN